MYTKILAQETKFGSGTTGLDHPVIRFTAATLKRIQRDPQVL